MRSYILANILLLVVPLVPAATTPTKDGDLGARADGDLINTSDSISIANGNIALASSDGERRACPGGWGACLSFPDICCPRGVQCCSNRTCCGKGYYCVKTSNGRIGCCPNNRICRG